MQRQVIARKITQHLSFFIFSILEDDDAVKEKKLDDDGKDGEEDEEEEKEDGNINLREGLIPEIDEVYIILDYELLMKYLDMLSNYIKSGTIAFELASLTIDQNIVWGFGLVTISTVFSLLDLNKPNFF